MSSVSTKLFSDESLPNVSTEAREILEGIAKAHYPSVWRLALNAMCVGYELGLGVCNKRLVDKTKLSRRMEKP